MTDPQDIPPTPEQAPESTPADPLTLAQAELAELKAKSAELADQFLRALSLIHI